MGLDGSGRARGLGVSPGWEGSRGCTVSRCEEGEVDGAARGRWNIRLSRLFEMGSCDEKFTHITGMKLWTVRLDAELESSSSFLHRADRSCLSALLSTS